MFLLVNAQPLLQRIELLLALNDCTIQEVRCALCLLLAIVKVPANERVGETIGDRRDLRRRLPFIPTLLSGCNTDEAPDEA